jgi:hypothetical protein
MIYNLRDGRYTWYISSLRNLSRKEEGEMTAHYRRLLFTRLILIQGWSLKFFLWNCLRMLRQCKGFERFSVSLKRTADGAVKRRRLEEVKDRSDSFMTSKSSVQT